MRRWRSPGSACAASMQSCRRAVLPCSTVPGPPPASQSTYSCTTLVLPALHRIPSALHRPLEFPSSSGAANLAAEQLAAMGLVESDSEAESGAAGSSGRGGAAAAGSEAAAAGGAGGAAAAAAAGQGGGAGGEDDEGSGGSSSEDDLPPIPRFQNRKFIEYAVSSDSEDEV